MIGQAEIVGEIDLDRFGEGGMREAEAQQDESERRKGFAKKADHARRSLMKSTMRWN